MKTTTRKGGEPEPEPTAGQDEMRLMPGGETGVAPYQVDDSDYVPSTYEPPPMRRFVAIRQKDLKTEEGRVVRPAGAFKFSDPADPEAEDKEELLLAVLDTNHGRVYFEEGKREPTCKSLDARRGSAPRQGDRYGECATCTLSKFSDDGERPDCREGWDVLCWDVSADLPVILSLTYSGYLVYKGYFEQMRRMAMDQSKFPRKDGQAPFIMHRFAVPVTTKFLRKGGYEYYVPAFGSAVEMPTDQQEKTRAARRLLSEEFMRARAERKVERDEYYGEDE